ncbi:hypothetical protein GHT06_012509 [Daphnia sinensis]|uniref:RNA polymerase II-associated factor 1 homolog n=1 Tax=Daphnia sinensis TaxID=1820382 RepID=A0AAD5LF29_9CRUS|nr:hypothetical protein GHT06_012509 [Daphnia sinensis]
MPPTINPPQNAERDRRRQQASSATAAPGERRTDLVCRVKYCNTLPDIPFDPKFITYPFDSNRFIQYNATSLEKSYKYELLAEYDLGITIDLINPEAYAKEKNAHLDPADERLLEEDTHHAPQDAKRKAQHAKNVSWLRRTEYISTEATRFQPMTIEKVEAKVGYSMKKALKEEHVYMDHESQIKAIEKTFADAKKPIVEHSSKKGVTAVEVLPVLPDFKLWKYPCAQVIFDANPAPVDRPTHVQVEEMSQAMIRGVMDETGEQFVAYFLPTSETLTKRARDASQSIDYDDNDEYDYKMARQYHWNVKSKASKGYEENYFIVFRDDAVYYNELETRVRLTKRRPKPGEPATSNTRLVLKHRSLTSREHRMFRQRERQLEPANQAEDEEEMEEDEEENDDEEEAEASGPRLAKEGEKEDEDKDAESDAQSDRSRSRSRSRSKSKSPRSASSAGSSSRSRSSSAASSHRSASPPAADVDQEQDKKSSSGSGSSSSSSSASSSASSSGSSSDSE